MPLQEASMLYFCFAVRGSLGSVGAGGGGSSCLLELFPSPRCTIASLPNSQPIITYHALITHTSQTTKCFEELSRTVDRKFHLDDTVDCYRAGVNKYPAVLIDIVFTFS